MTSSSELDRYFGDIGDAVTLDDVRRYQKRTRDKEYRLRRQKAAQSKIDQVSPRKSWTEVKQMNAAQRTQYVRRLERFNRMPLVGSESGDVIPTRYITQARKLMRAHNKFVERETKRIEGLAPDLWEKYRAKQMGILAHEQSIGGLLTPVDISKMEKPRSLEVAKRRVANYEKRAKHKFGFYRKIQKRNMMYMLERVGEFDLSEVVRNMTSDQFDILSSVLPMWESLSVEYESTSLIRGKDADTRHDDIRSYVYKAYAIGAGRDELKTIASLERTRRKRTASAMRRFRNTPGKTGLEPK